MDINSISSSGGRGDGQTPTPAELGGSRQIKQSKIWQHLLKAVLLFTMVTLACLVIFQTYANTPKNFQFFPRSVYSFSFPFLGKEKETNRLEKILERAAMADNKTVIITTLNEAWIEPNSIFDLFLESFRIGNQTSGLLTHLVVVALDQKAFDHCLKTQTQYGLHCYFLSTDGVNFSGETNFMTPDYLKMMWRRIDFLRIVLQMGFNFVFTDADIMWLRNPFPHFYTDTNFQISCDSFGGNPTDLHNAPNGGFNFVRSANQTIAFYEFWYKSREKHPGKHDQDVLNVIKYDPFVRDIIKLEIKFLDTVYFGGFCQPSKDLNRVCTMHANCCVGLDNKIHDLRILLDDWKKYLSLQRETKPPPISWSVPQKCGAPSFHHHTPRKRNGNRRL